MVSAMAAWKDGAALSPRAAKKRTCLRLRMLNPATFANANIAIRIHVGWAAMKSMRRWLFSGGSAREIVEIDAIMRGVLARVDGALLDFLAAQRGGEDIEHGVPAHGVLRNKALEDGKVR